MAPILDCAGDLTIFLIGNGGAGLLLIGSSSDPDVEIPATTFFVFTRSLLPSETVARGSHPEKTDGQPIEQVSDPP